VAEAHESVHERKLPGVVEFETGNAFPCRGDCRLRQHSQLPAVDESFYDILLDVQIVVVDRREGAAQGGQVFDGFVDAVVGDVVGAKPRCAG
jgi:hypothetical protein